VMLVQVAQKQWVIFYQQKNNTKIIVIRHHKNTKNFRAAKARDKKRSKKK